MAEIIQSYPSAPAVCGNVEVEIIDTAGQRWLTLKDCVRCLYHQERVERQGPPLENETRAVRKLLDSHKEDFDDDMVSWIVLPTPGGPQRTRIVSLTGLCMLTMLARTSDRKALRRWLLDVLEGKGQPLPPAPRQLAEPVDSSLEALYDPARLALVEQWVASDIVWLSDGREPVRGKGWFLAQVFKDFAATSGIKARMKVPEFKTLLTIVARKKAIDEGLNRDAYLIRDKHRLIGFRVDTTYSRR